MSDASAVQSMVEAGPSTVRIAGLMVVVILASFAFGVAMFLPAEHRAEKLQELQQRYQARNPDAPRSRPMSTKRILLPARFDRLPVLEGLGGNFTLESTRGGPLGPADFRGSPVLINFGYAACPDVCPTTLRRLHDVLAALSDHTVTVLFVSLDPERDTVERLTGYLQAFDPRFVGLRGSPQEVAEVARLFRVYQDAGVQGGMVHSNEIYLLDDEGRTRATFSANITVQEMVDTVARVL
jgi:protein SCO1/2